LTTYWGPRTSGQMYAVPRRWTSPADPASHPGMRTESVTCRATDERRVPLSGYVTAGVLQPATGTQTRQPTAARSTQTPATPNPTHPPANPAQPNPPRTATTRVSCSGIAASFPARSSSPEPRPTTTSTQAARSHAPTVPSLESTRNARTCLTKQTAVQQI
jgi:hypothetical protein